MEQIRKRINILTQEANRLNPQIFPRCLKAKLRHLAKLYERLGEGEYKTILHTLNKMYFDKTNK